MSSSTVGTSPLRSPEASSRRPAWAFGDDRGQRLVQLMRERRRQLAERRHARHVRQLGACRLGIDLGPLPLGDLGVRHHRAALGPIEPMNRHDPEARPRRGGDRVRHDTAQQSP